MAWIGGLLEGKVAGSRRADLGTARRALRYHLHANPGLAHTVLDACYSSRDRTAAAHLAALADLFARAARARSSSPVEVSSSPGGRQSPAGVARVDAAEAPSCSPAKLIALVLYKLVHPSATVRDDAVALLKAVAALDLGVDDAGGDGHLAEIFSQDTLPELPDAYQRFSRTSRRDSRGTDPRLARSSWWKRWADRWTTEPRTPARTDTCSRRWLRGRPRCTCPTSPRLDAPSGFSSLCTLSRFSAATRFRGRWRLCGGTSAAHRVTWFPR